MPKQPVLTEAKEADSGRFSRIIVLEGECNRYGCGWRFQEVCQSSDAERMTALVSLMRKDHAECCPFCQGDLVIWEP